MNSRSKGKRLELEARDVVRKAFNAPDCVRSAQVSGTYSADLLYGLRNGHIEVKGRRTLGVQRFVDQAVRDIGRSPQYPVVLARENSGPWLLVLRVNDLPLFLNDLASSPPS